MKKLRFFLALLLIATLCAAAAFLAVSSLFPIRHMDTITANAGDLDPALILAVIMAESSFDQTAQSRAGAQGLMQLMPDTAADIARRMGNTDFAPHHVWNPDTNIQMGIFYLSWLKARYNGNVELALAAYNAGLGNVDSWLANPQFSADGVNLTSIPFPETENYIRRVNQFRRVYQILLAVRQP